MKDPVETILTRAHIKLMRHRETYMYAGVIAMGKSEIVDNIPTAATNGRDKVYSRAFMSKLSLEEVCAVVLHENLHVILKHIPRHKDLWKEDAKTANIAMDYVVNAIIHDIKDKTLCKFTKEFLYDPQFDGWSVREVYHFLKTGKDPKGEDHGEPEPQDGDDDQGQGQGQDQNKDDGKIQIGDKSYGGDTLDDHEEMTGASEEEVKQIDEQIEKEVDAAIQQATTMAGMTGAAVPRALKKMLSPEIDWREVLREFVKSSIQGRDEYTFARFDRRRYMDDLYQPDVESEQMDEVVVAIDTSGSIDDNQIAEFATELSIICTVTKPRRVRVLWWDDKVHGEQMFEDKYSDIKDMLRPMGGGGTRVTCVSEYLTKNNIKSDCVIVFTDGYLECDIQWAVRSPTLWMVTQSERFKPPVGSVVKYNKRTGV